MMSVSRRFGPAVALALVMGSAGSARAGVIFSMQVGFTDPFETRGTVTGLTFGFGVNGSPTLFDETTLDPSSLGTTLVAGSTAANFGAVSGYLTDGVDETIQAPIELVGGSAKLANRKLIESLLFHGDLSGANGIDWAGYTIDRITLTVDALSLTPGFGGKLGTDPITTVEFRGTLNIEGFAAAPEPSTLVLGGLAGLFGLGYYGLRRRRAAGSAA